VARSSARKLLALRLPQHSRRRLPMLMFKRSQLYLGLALAGLAEIIIRAMAN
jgi:hypothetical protein